MSQQTHVGGQNKFKSDENARNFGPEAKVTTDMSGICGINKQGNLQ